MNDEILKAFAEELRAEAKGKKDKTLVLVADALQRALNTYPSPSCGNPIKTPQEAAQEAETPSEEMLPGQIATISTPISTSSCCTPKYAPSRPIF